MKKLYHVIALQEGDMDAAYKANANRILVINDLPSETEEDRKLINDIILTTYDATDVLSAIPQCVCGNLTMGFRLGKICELCHTSVERPTEGLVENRVWIKAPSQILGFIDPHIWNILEARLGKYSILEWMTNPATSPPNKTSKSIMDKIYYLESIGWKRGLNNFIRNIDWFIEILPKLTNKPCHDLQEKLRRCKGTMFPKYMPLPTRLLMVVDKTAVGTFTEAQISFAVDAARTISTLSRNTSLTSSYVERKVVTVNRNLCNYYRETNKTSLKSKSGWLRGQIFSSRSNWCSRSVICSNHEPHMYDEILIPWNVGVEVYKFHLYGKLARMGVSLREVYALIETSGQRYSPILDKLLKELIDESPDKALNVIMQRNPTLRYNSAQRTRVVRVKTDVHDESFAWSPLVLRGPNADHDGDECNHQHMLDNEFSEAADMLAPHFAIHSFSHVGEFNHCLEIPSTTISVWSNYVNGSL